MESYPRVLQDVGRGRGPVHFPCNPSPDRARPKSVRNAPGLKCQGCPRPFRGPSPLLAFLFAYLHLCFQSPPGCPSRNPFCFMLLHCCRGWAYPCNRNTPTMHEHKRAVRQIKARWKLTKKVFLFVSLPRYVLTSLLRFQARRNSSRRRCESRWLLWRKTVCSSTRSSRMTRQPRFWSAARSTATGVAPSARYRRATTGEITCRLASTKSITRRGTCF